MAVDTGNKRFSLIGHGLPVPSMLPIPDGAIAVADRAMLLFLYHGLALGAEAEVSTIAVTVYGPNPNTTVYGPNPLAPLEADR